MAPIVSSGHRRQTDATGLSPNGLCAFLVHLPQMPGEVNHLYTTGGAGEGLGVRVRSKG